MKKQHLPILLLLAWTSFQVSAQEQALTRPFYYFAILHFTI
jgi:hypothetical protein